MSRTVNDLIKDVLLLLNVVSPAETPSHADATQVLSVLQDLMAEWAGSRLMVPALTTETLTLVSSTASYAVGQDGSPALNTVRPEQVVGAVIRSGGYDYSLALIGEREYRLQMDKSSPTGQPSALYVLYTMPNAVFYPLPVPSAAYELIFTSVKPLKEIAAVTENLATVTGLPRNYYNALKFNAALEVGVYFEKPPTVWLERRAVETIHNIKALNLARTLEPVRLEIAGSGVSGNILGF